MKDKKSTAYHEAGHAVAKAHFRLKIKKVTIVGKDDCAGYTAGRRATNRSIEYEQSGRVQLNAERDIIVSLAGIAAQREFMPRSVRRHHWGGDRDNALDLLWRIASPEALPPYFKLLEIRARELVKLPHIRAQIEALAKALLTHGTLDGKQAKGVIQDALGKAK